jgi:putative membrane protein
MKRSGRFLRDLALLLSLVLVITCASVGICAAGEKTQQAPTTVVTALENETAAVQEAAAGLYKNETVYVLAEADGTVKQIIVSDWIENSAGADTISDTTSLSDIAVTKGETTYVMNSDDLCLWNANGEDVHYQGAGTTALPVNLSVSFRLDGEPISAEELAGKSGRVTIRFDYENQQSEWVEIDGKQTKMYVPFLMLTGMALSNDNFTNIEVTNGKIINDGERSLVIGMALPGMQENLDIDRDTLDIPDFVEISADVTDFELATTYTVAANPFSGELSLDGIDSIEDLEDALQTLDDSALQLVDGMAALSEGLTTLQEQSGSLTEAVTQLQNLSNGASSVSENLQTLSGYLKELRSGLQTLSNNSQALNDGAKQTFDALLSAANTQLAAAGVSAPALTVDNYDAVLDGVIANLSGDAAYNMAYQTAYATVSATVEASRDYITTQVTAAVRQQVLEAVLASQGYTMDMYNASEELRAAIDPAVDAQMNTPEVQATISQTVDAQIQALIDENMNSDAVQQQIQAGVAQAEAGGSAVQALKEQLDSYSTFYQGVLAYTAGVDSACAASGQISAGADQLLSGTVTLANGAEALYQGLDAGTEKLLAGVDQLAEGAATASDGMQTFYDEGIHKLSELYGDDVSPLLSRIRAMADLAETYRTYSGLSDGMDGSVKFIYRTDAIEAADDSE